MVNCSLPSACARWQGEFPDQRRWIQDGASSVQRHRGDGPRHVSHRHAPRLEVRRRELGQRQLHVHGQVVTPLTHGALERQRRLALMRSALQRHLLLRKLRDIHEQFFQHQLRPQHEIAKFQRLLCGQRGARQMLECWQPRHCQPLASDPPRSRRIKAQGEMLHGQRAVRSAKFQAHIFDGNLRQEDGWQR